MAGFKEFMKFFLPEVAVDTVAFNADKIWGFAKGILDNKEKMQMVMPGYVFSGTHQTEMGNIMQVLRGIDQNSWLFITSKWIPTLNHRYKDMAVTLHEQVKCAGNSADDKNAERREIAGDLIAIAHARSEVVEPTQYRQFLADNIVRAEMARSHGWFTHTREEDYAIEHGKKFFRIGDREHWPKRTNKRGPLTWLAVFLGL